MNEAVHNLPSERFEVEHIAPADIERRSFEIIRAELAERDIKVDPCLENVVLRVIHTTADFDFAQNMVFSENALSCLRERIASGTSICTDTQMAKMGINQRVLSRFGGSVHCFMSDEDVAREAAERGVTRAIVSMERAMQRKEPLIFVIGNAPTALLHIYNRMKEGFEPAFVVGVPVGFVNVEVAKERILRSKVPHIVSRGRKGGSTVAAAIINAVLYELAE